MPKLRWELAKVGQGPRVCDSRLSPKGPYTAHFRTLAPTAIPAMVFGTRVLTRAVHGRFEFLHHDYGLMSQLKGLAHFGKTAR